MPELWGTTPEDFYGRFRMLLSDEQELLDYVTEKYGEREKPAQKEWSFQEHFNFIQEDLEEMLFDLFARYGITHGNFNLDNYFMPEFYWWQFRLKKIGVTTGLKC
ncbi:DUF1493 family protein [Mangrovibacter sp. SLW1]